MYSVRAPLKTLKYNKYNKNKIANNLIVSITIENFNKI